MKARSLSNLYGSIIIRIGTNASAREKRIRKCLSLIPPKKSMIIITKATHIVMDILGSKIIKPQMIPPTKITGIRVLKCATSLLLPARYLLAKRTKANLAISLGCKVKKGSLIHLDAP